MRELRGAAGRRHVHECQMPGQPGLQAAGPKEAVAVGKDDGKKAGRNKVRKGSEKYPGTGGFTYQGQKTCPVCQKRYPVSLGHACPDCKPAPR